MRPRILETHCLVATAAVLTFVWTTRAERHTVERLFLSPVGQLVLLLWMMSAFVFPLALADRVIGRLPWWRSVPLILLDLALSLVQYLALGLALPVRY